MATQRGVGVVFGVSGMTFTGFGTITGIHNKNHTYRRESDSKEIRNGDGDVVGKVYYNERRTMTLEVVPAGADINTSQTNAVNLLGFGGTPAPPGTIVTVAEADTQLDPIWETPHSGAWLLENMEMRRTDTDEALITLELMQYTANVATAIS